MLISLFKMPDVKKMWNTFSRFIFRELLAAFSKLFYTLIR